MSDEQVQEFNLDGKQLAFVVISGIAVAVVVFLCGVMVGRGVRAPMASAPVALGATGEADGSAAPDPFSTDVSAVAGALELPKDDLRPLDRLGEAPSLETLREPVPEPVTPPPPPVPAQTTAADAALKEPPGPGFSVQVLSVTRLAEAQDAARGLGAKGYPSFISETSAVGHRFRVRIGKYPTRREALAVAARLEKEENFKKPWVDESR